MVIQNNIPGLNSKRIYNKNSSKLAKSLEKLSSRYSINRAADDSAGLAVSEKMRSQICGMKQSVKNCQDGISLIQTFEGALGETVAIIKRMKSLADQSANGTYDDNVDRNAVEIEYLHLCDEVNHIAETDFNGLVMLNGKGSAENAEKLERAVNSAINNRLNSASSVSAYSDVLQTALAFTAVKAAAFAAPRAGGTACGDFTVYGNSSDFSFDTASGVLTILGGNVTVEGTGAPTENTIVVAKDKSAKVTLRNVNIDVSSTDNACAFKIEDDSMGDVAVTLEGNNFLKSGGNCAGLQKNGDVASGTLTIDGDGCLDTYGGICGAGIGGSKNGSANNIIIDGGTITSIAGNADNVAAYQAGRGAGIGGGNAGSGSNITINDGKVIAEGDCGIGAGYSASAENIVINGGYVIAQCKTGYGAGIGASRKNTATNITINGGNISAIGGGASAGIGGGSSGKAIKITITGGEILAVGRSGAGIGGGDNFGVNVGAVSAEDITITGGTIKAIADGGAGIGGGASGSGKNITISGGSITAVTDGYGAGIGGGAGGSGINIVISNGNIITSSLRGAGIGGGSGTTSGGDGEIYIYGGNIYATSVNSFYGAGIGGGLGGKGAVTITGGFITAIGGEYGAGIGGGGSRYASPNVGTVDVKGASTVVIAKAGNLAENIGSGVSGDYICHNSVAGLGQ